MKITSTACLNGEYENNSHRNDGQHIIMVNEIVNG